MKLSEVIHYYIGCKILNQYYDRDIIGVLMGVIDREVVKKAVIQNFDIFKQPWGRLVEEEVTPPSGIKLCLRPLSSMTEEEALYFFSIQHAEVLLYKPISFEISDAVQKISYEVGGSRLHQWRIGISLSPKEFQFLLSNGFDLFGLIKSNQALDITKLNKDAK